MIYVVIIIHTLPGAALAFHCFDFEIFEAKKGIHILEGGLGESGGILCSMGILRVPPGTTKDRHHP